MKKNIYKTIRGIFWTALIFGGLFLVDRIFMGPSIIIEWTEAKNVPAFFLDEGATLKPPYLPRFVKWPPSRVFTRKITNEGWWMELVNTDGAPTAWVGSGKLPAPQELGAISRCLETGPAVATNCPSGWYLLSTEVKTGTVIYVITNMDPLEAKRTITAFE